MIEDILSPEEEDDGIIGGGGRETGGGSCCNSSHFSDNNKSEKNMSDFDGEGVLSDEELTMAAACHIGPGHTCSGGGTSGNIVTISGPTTSRQLAGIATLYPLQSGGQRPIISAQGRYFCTRLVWDNQFSRLTRYFDVCCSWCQMLTHWKLGGG
jgi:hypothetical protein